MGKAPLNGLRVIELGVYLNGPYTARLLAELGAEVIKVEPPYGDPMRLSPPMVHGDSLHSVFYNAGKKFITLNLKTQRGRELFLRLISRADILIENFRPGTMEKLGLAYEVLSKVNPRLIYVSITGWGQTGPYRDLPGFDPVIQAMSGLMSTTGYPDSPTRAGVALLDIVTPAFAVAAALAALHDRDSTNKGSFLDMSMYDVAVALTMQSIVYLYAGYPTRCGPSSAVFAPEYLFKTCDGYVYVMIQSDAAWENFCKSLNETSWLTNEGFKSIQGRVDNRAEINKMVQERVKELTSDELMNLVISSGGAAAPFKELVDAMNDAHTLERNMIVKMPYGDTEIKLPGTVFKINGYNCGFEWLGLQKGYHNKEVFRELLGMNEEEVSTLQRENVI
jgi:CoA:oxalate CoA-transferase